MLCKQAPTEDATMDEAAPSRRCRRRCRCRRRHCKAVKGESRTAANDAVDALCAAVTSRLRQRRRSLHTGLPVASQLTRRPSPS